MRCIVGIHQKLVICYIICCVVSGIHGRELFSRNLRQQGHHYLEHSRTLEALGLGNGRRPDDYSPCGGVIGCGLINITESGKRKRSSHDFDKLPLRKNMINSRSLLNQIIQKQIPLDMANKYSFYKKPTNSWNGKQNIDRKTDKRNPTQFISLENLYKGLRNMRHPSILHPELTRKDQNYLIYSTSKKSDVIEKLS